VKRTPLSVICITLSVLVCGTGCDRDESIHAYQAPKDPPPVVQTAAPGAMPGGMPPAAPGAGGLPSGVPGWTAPAGWKELPGDGQMRAATFVVSENPKAELTVIPLGPEAGDLLPNVNRWEGQLKLPPTAADKLASMTKEIDVNGLKATIVDLTGPESAAGSEGRRQRLLAAIVPSGGRIWYFKLMGPNEVVSAQKGNFDQFVHSLKPGAAQPMPTGPAEAAAQAQPDTSAGQNTATASGKITHWTAPPGWTEVPASSGPRLLAFSIAGDGEKKAEMVITKFPADAMADTLSNINRWRGQIGLEPVTDAKNTAMQDASIGRNGQGVLLEFSNPDNAKRMLVVIGSMGNDAWFYKLSGSADVVEAQREPFVAFLKSLEFGPAASESGR
jgi:hypothetical protein